MSPSTANVLARAAGVSAGVSLVGLFNTALAQYTVQSTNIPWQTALTSDLPRDQQTGTPDADFLGNPDAPVMSWFYDSTGGNLFFRTRFNGTENKPDWVFNSVLLIGLDWAASSDPVPNQYGKMDAFLIVDTRSNGQYTGIALTGTQANVSPSTSDFGTITKFSGTGTSELFTNRYNFTYTGSDLDPLVGKVGNGTIDGYATASFSLSSITAFTGITAATPLRFGVLTAQQPNTINQDVIGDWNQTWTQNYVDDPPPTPPNEIGNRVLAYADDVTLNSIHKGGTFTGKPIVITNPLSNPLASTIDATVGPPYLNGGTATGTVDNLATGATSNAITGNIAPSETLPAGLQSGSVKINYSSGTSNASIGSEIVTISGMIYSGQSTWAQPGSGSWGVPAGQDPSLPANAATIHNLWSTNDGAPGVWLGAALGNFDDVDRATFSTSTGATASNINIISPVSIADMTFNNTLGGTYAVSASTGSLTFKSSYGDSLLTDSSASGTNVITAPVNLADNLIVSVTTAGDTLQVTTIQDGTSDFNVTKTGVGTLHLTGDSTYTGSTTVNAGTLLVTGTIANGTGAVVNNTGTLAGDGTGDISGSEIVGTTGIVHDEVTINSGGTISPGLAPGLVGQLATGEETWNSGGNYPAQITTASAYGATGFAAGAGDTWDILSMTGIVQGSTTLDKFNVNVTGVDMTLADRTYAWLIAESTAGTFDTSRLSLNISGFTQDSFKFSLMNGLSLFARENLSGGSGSNLYVVYTYNAVPEATSLLLGCLGLTPVVLHRRRARNV